MKEWTESSLLTKMDTQNRSDPNRHNESAQILGRFLVTLKLFNIWQEKLNMEHISPCVWVPCTNYWMARDARKRFNKYVKK